MSNGKEQSLRRIANPVFRRRLFIRVALCILLAALGAFSMIVGKGHSIVLDDMRPKDGSYESVRALSVRVDRGKPIALSTGVREIVVVTGQRHTLTVDWLDGSAPLARAFEIPFGQEFVIVAIPKLKAGIEPAIEPFFPYANTKPAEEPASAPAPNGEAAAPKP